VSSPLLRRRVFGRGGSAALRVTAFAAFRNSSLIAPGFVRFLLPSAVSLTAEVLSFALALVVLLFLQSPFGRIGRPRHRPEIPRCPMYRLRFLGHRIKAYAAMAAV